MPKTSSDELKSMDLVYLALLLFVVGVVGAASFLTQEPTSDRSKAIRRAENLALQLEQIRKHNLKQLKSGLLDLKTDERGPVSVELGPSALHELLRPFKKSGEIGSDPWGKAYSYDTLIYQNATYLLVWSGGRDGHKSSDSADLLIAATESRSLPYQGDDLGLVLTMEP